MSIAGQLYELQEIESSHDSTEQTIHRIASHLGESEAVVRARQELEEEQRRLEELRHQQQAKEWEVDDVSTKVKGEEEKLLSGRISNPKELANLQHEVEALKAKRGHLEDEELEIMDQAERAEADIADRSGRLKALEVEWQGQQQQLATEMEMLKKLLSSLSDKREQLLAHIDPRVVKSYRALRQHKGIAVAKVEQGICRGCGVSLPASDLQRARSDDLAQCSSCRRILFLA
ncbi:zinc ribbon domain-containing protein [Chloroflexota bacterium]